MVKILYDQFPATLRYTGISFAWSISAAIFSGTAPMVAQMLTTHTWLLGPSLYVSLIAIITCGAMNLSSKFQELKHKGVVYPLKKLPI